MGNEEFVAIFRISWTWESHAFGFHFVLTWNCLEIFMMKNGDVEDYMISSGLCMLCSYGILFATIISCNCLKIERLTYDIKNKRN